MPLKRWITAGAAKPSLSWERGLKSMAPAREPLMQTSQTPGLLLESILGKTAPYRLISTPPDVRDGSG